MSTQVLQLHNLAELMSEMAARAIDPSLRSEHETDAVMYGKLIVLDGIAESVWMGETLPEEEETLLYFAQERLDRAWTRLEDLVFPNT